MMPSSPSVLSWQTNLLLFRQTSLAAVQQALEQHYGTPISLYHRAGERWVHEQGLSPQQAHAVRPEIRLRLFLYWEPQQDRLVIRGVEG